MRSISHLKKLFKKKTFSGKEKRIFLDEKYLLYSTGRKKLISFKGKNHLQSLLKTK